jgi:uncharacterized protein YutE (UPF0331/DUF86 family)
MIDKKRILAKVDELDRYLYESQSISPKDFKDYQRTEIKRSCERLLQLSVECVIDICKIFVSNLKLGLPSEENDLFDKMESERIITEEMAVILKEMKGFRNILVHEYAVVDDEMVYTVIKTRLGDFKKFKKQIIDWMS